MSEEKLNQSMSFSGGQLSGVQAGQAGRDLSQNQQFNQAQVEKQLSSDDVIELIEQIETLFKGSDLTNSQKEKAVQHLEIAKAEATETQPDKDFALKSLQRATRILKNVDETATVGQNLWQKLEPIAKKLAPWFGVAAKTLLGM
ncbi:MAG TPA: hypothetical protein V6D10_15770 [Trichocoleus sp.]|jgi:hypothetical protein